MSVDYTILLDKIKEKGLTAGEIAIKIQVPEGRVYKWLQGKSQPRAEDARKLQNLLEGKGQKINATDMVALSLIDVQAMLRVILSVLAETEAARTGVMVGQTFAKLERAVEAEREAIRQGLSR